MVKSATMASSIALFVAYISSALAFQAASTTSPFSRVAQTSSNQCRRHIINLSVLSKESSEEIVDNSADDDEDEEDWDADSWALREIKFLQLPAASTNAVDDDNYDPTADTTMDVRGLSEFLMEIGACSVSITDSDKDTPEEDPVFDEPGETSCTNDVNDVLLTEEENSYALVLEDRAVGRNIWKRCDVSAHFPASLDVSTIIDSLRYTFNLPSAPRYSVDDVPDMDWIKHVQESWTPIITRDSKFVLRFPWHEDDVVMKACQEMEREKMQAAMAAQFDTGVKREGAVVNFYNEDSDQKVEERAYVQIELEGGIAFGTGEHPTTRLCLDWVRDTTEELLKSNTECINFVDYGAGSGVLGMAAAAVVRDYNQRRRKKEPTSSLSSIQTIGVEIDADAIRIADDNAKKNGVEMKNYLPDIDTLDDEALSVVMRAMQRKRNKGIETLPEELNGPVYDLCAANILARPLVGLAPVLASLVKAGGKIGLSGVLSMQAESVVEAYTEFFDDVKVADEENGWVLISGTRK